MFRFSSRGLVQVTWNGNSHQQSNSEPSSRSELWNVKWLWQEPNWATWTKALWHYNWLIILPIYLGQVVCSSPSFAAFITRLVGGWTNPVEKYACQSGWFPQIFGLKIKNPLSCRPPPTAGCVFLLIIAHLEEIPELQGFVVCFYRQPGHHPMLASGRNLPERHEVLKVITVYIYII